MMIKAQINGTLDILFNISWKNICQLGVNDKKYEHHYRMGQNVSLWQNYWYILTCFRASVVSIQVNFRSQESLISLSL